MKEIKIKDEQKWLEKRKSYITATEMMFAVTNFCNDEDFKTINAEFATFLPTKYQFYCLKKLNNEQLKLWNAYLNEKQTNRQKTLDFGTNNELLVAEQGLKHLMANDESFKDAKLVANGKNLWIDGNIASTPDFFIERKNGDKVLLECKTRAYKENDNELENTLKQYGMQVKTQMLTTGIKEGYIAMGFHENFEMKEVKTFKIEVDDAMLHLEFDCMQQSANSCIEWINNVDKGEESNCFDNQNDDDIAMKNIVEKSLKEIAEKYFENNELLTKYHELLQNKEINEDLLNATFKMIANENITIDDICIDVKKTKTSYYTIDKIDKQIAKLQSIKQQLEQGEQVISRNGSLSLERVYKNGFNG